MRRQFGDDPIADKAHTTCAIAILFGTINKSLLRSVDSRIFRLNREDIVCRTCDHSLIQELLDRDLLTEREMGDIRGKTN